MVRQVWILAQVRVHAAPGFGAKSCEVTGRPEPGLTPKISGKKLDFHRHTVISCY
jgi:hypothetical protein